MTPTAVDTDSQEGKGRDPASTGDGGRTRYRPRERSRWQRVPLSAKILAPLVLATAVWFGVEAWRGSRIVITFVTENGAPPPLDLTIYADEYSFAVPSPSPPLGTLRVASGATAVLDADLVRGSAFVRITGPGIGTGYSRVVRGREVEPVLLSPPGHVDGVVQSIVPLGFYGLALQGIAGARVVGLGGGDLGVPLCETTTDAAGRFTLAGFDARIPLLGVRVLATGFAKGFVNHLAAEHRPLAIEVAHTQDIRGRIELPPGVEPSSLRLLAKGLPGIEATIGSDGTFVLDHVASHLEPRLLVYGLPREWTHATTNASGGDHDVVIRVVRATSVQGYVLERSTQQRVKGATVSHEHGPAGHEAVVTGADGSFEIGRVPPGELRLHAQATKRGADRRETTWVGERLLRIEAGVDQTSIIIRVE